MISPSDLDAIERGKEWLARLASGEVIPEEDEGLYWRELRAGADYDPDEAWAEEQAYYRSRFR